MPEGVWVPDPIAIRKLGKLTHVDVIAIEEADQLPEIVISRRLAKLHEEAAALSPHVLDAFDPSQPLKERGLIALTKVADACRY